MDVPQPTGHTMIKPVSEFPRRRHTSDNIYARSQRSLCRTSTNVFFENDTDKALFWNAATTAINCAPIECSFSSPSSSTSSLESATSQLLKGLQGYQIPAFPMLKRKDSLQLVTTIQSESSDSSTLAPSYFFDAFFEEDDSLIDDDLTLSESCSPDSPSHLLSKGSNFSDSRFAFPPTLRQRPIDPSHIVTDRIACMLREHFPPRHSLKQNWDLEYSFAYHGISMSTLYSNTKGKEPCILAVRDEYDGIFGAYISERIHPSQLYYGNGECFLWKCDPNGGSFQVYHCTGMNTYMILTQKGFIALGGGHGKFGLWINSDLEHGYSEACETFCNDILSTRPRFQCIDMEIWSLSD
ncbi:hypothetical protein NQZ79_g5052 [Umbelopsis isabellina]|nr:hypothetical protein NQZ79_g5052 [Umbelopsis isabellina]